jgi:succinate dehydrogenase/fumarate reductase flavoprotein subunit
MPEGALQDTVERYNGFVRAGTDAAYGKRILEDAAPIAEPPFYAIRTWPKVHHTMGGVHIDAEARVIGHDLNPVPGLFAAGEITGGVHGAVRLGSCAVTDCLVFGRIAGRHAAA